MLGLALCSRSLLAADVAPPRGKVDPAILKKVERELGAFARTLNHVEHMGNKFIFALLADHVRKNPQIYRAAFAFAQEKKTAS
jgi:hypothetical protein